MDLSVNERLREFLRVKEIKYEVFRKKIGVGRLQQVSNWMNFKEKVPDKCLREIVIQYKDINARWLLTGEGEMLNEKQEMKSFNDSAKPENLVIIMEEIEHCIKIMQKTTQMLHHNLGDKNNFLNENVKIDA